MVIGEIPVEYQGGLYWIGGMKVGSSNQPRHLLLLLLDQASEVASNLEEFIRSPQDFVGNKTSTFAKVVPVADDISMNMFSVLDHQG